jgi:hypothetical protein
MSSLHLNTRGTDTRLHQSKERGVSRSQWKDCTLTLKLTETLQNSVASKLVLKYSKAFGLSIG